VGRPVGLGGRVGQGGPRGLGGRVGRGGGRGGALRGKGQRGGQGEGLLLQVPRCITRIKGGSHFPLQDCIAASNHHKCTFQWKTIVCVCTTPMMSAQCPESNVRCSSSSYCNAGLLAGRALDPRLGAAGLGLIASRWLGRSLS
jgi:hypothetical protein